MHRCLPTLRRRGGGGNIETGAWAGVKLAPWGSQFDAYRMRYTRTWRPGGYRNPLQRLMRSLVRRQLLSSKS